MQLEVVWYTVRVFESQLHTPTLKYSEYLPLQHTHTPGPGGRAEAILHNLYGYVAHDGVVVSELPIYNELPVSISE